MQLLLGPILIVGNSFSAEEIKAVIGPGLFLLVKLFRYDNAFLFSVLLPYRSILPCDCQGTL